MQLGIYLPNFGDFADPRVLMSLAQEAEESGWDGFFLWDHIQWTIPQSEPLADPWIVLTAIAVVTKRIKLGPLVTPIARRRPWKIAREAVTLDHMPNGRLMLGVGIGGDWCHEYSAFAEPVEDKRHAKMLDEDLEILARLWRGEPMSYQGRHYQLTDVHFLPQPHQSPRIPVWVAGVWPGTRPFCRAASLGQSLSDGPQRGYGTCGIPHDVGIYSRTSTGSYAFGRRVRWKYRGNRPFC